jgi:hypothetical protein
MLLEHITKTIISLKGTQTNIKTQLSINFNKILTNFNNQSVRRNCTMLKANSKQMNQKSQLLRLDHYLVLYLRILTMGNKYQQIK